jgi:hypothetical protein
MIGDVIGAVEMVPRRFCFPKNLRFVVFNMDSSSMLAKNLYHNELSTDFHDVNIFNGLSTDKYEAEILIEVPID